MLARAWRQVLNLKKEAFTNKQQKQKQPKYNPIINALAEPFCLSFLARYSNNNKNITNMNLMEKQDHNQLA